MNEPVGAPAPRRTFSWGDFFAFRVMITPTLIRIVYLVGVVIITAAAVLVVFSVPATTCVTQGDATTCTGPGAGALPGAILLGLIVFIVGQLYWRVITELLFVIFGIHESVRAIEGRS